MPISIENIHGAVGEFQRPYIYKLTIYNIPTDLTSKFSGSTAFSSDADIYNTKAVFPDRKTNSESIKWCGEFFDIPTTDNSTRATDFEFFDDEDQNAWDFFSALKDYTGNEVNQAGVRGINSKFDMTVYQVSVDKETITASRQLKGCRVYELSKSEVSKDGDSISKIIVNIHWDRNIEDKTQRGKTI